MMQPGCAWAERRSADRAAGPGHHVSSRWIPASLERRPRACVLYLASTAKSNAVRRQPVSDAHGHAERLAAVDGRGRRRMRGQDRGYPCGGAALRCG